MNDIQKKIEALIFYKNEPLSFSYLAKQLSLSEDEILHEVHTMLPFYKERGISLIITENNVSLVSSSELKSFIEAFENSEEEKELSRASLETLSIILYKGKITKAEIDYIRGVNSLYVLRNLLLRGLIEKIPNKNDRRSPLYVVSPMAFAYLGIHKREELPDFEVFAQKLKSIEKSFLEEKEENDKEGV